MPNSRKLFELNRCFLWITVCIDMVLTSGSLRAESFTVPTKETPLSYFGMHIHKADLPAHWPEVEFGAWRLIDAYVTWNNLQPDQEKWNFSTLDTYVSMADRKNIELLLPLAFSPKWVSARPDERGPYGPGTAAEPRDLKQWRDYVRKVATRYRGQIRQYELWNEVNEKGFFSGAPDRLLELQREAYTILKSIDPENILVSPSVVGGGWQPSWFDDYLQKGGARYADVIGYHFYAQSEAPEAMVRTIRKIKDIMIKNGVQDKPLWNTEAGWWISNSDNTPEESGAVGPTWLKLGPSQAADFVSRALIIAKAEGIDRFYWYAWDNRNMGLIEPTNKTMKPAAMAYSRTAMWLVGAVMEGCNIDGYGTWVCKLNRQNDRNAWIIWNPEKRLDMKLPQQWNAVEYQTLDGATHEIRDQASGRGLIGSSPILVKTDSLPW